MSKKQYIFWGLLFFPVILFSALHAQSEKKQNVFTSFGGGARAQVLKSTYVAMADDYAAAHWNPGGVAFSQSIQFGGMHSMLSLNRQAEFIAVIVPISSANKIGISWKGFLIDNIPARTVNTETPTYLFSNMEQVIGFTYARKLFSRVGLGVNLKYFLQSLDGVNAGGWGGDAGLMIHANSNIKIGLVIYDIRSYVKWSTGNTDAYKQTGRLGISYQLTPNSLLAVAMENGNTFSSAAEVKLMEPLWMRMGWQEKILSLGVGFNYQLKNMLLKFNYAVANNKITDELAHLFDLSVSFQRSTKIKKRSYQFVVIKTASLNVRSGPGIKFKKIAYVYEGQRFLLLGREGDWLKIKYALNRTGWIKKDYAEIRKK